PHPPRRTATALERDERRYELRRPASGAAVLRRTARARDSLLHAAPCGEARPDRMGPGEVPLRLLDRGRHGKAALRPLLHQAPLDRLRPDHRARHGQGDPLRKGRQVIARRTYVAADPWGQDDRQLITVARNVSTRYLAI